MLMVAESKLDAMALAIKSAFEDKHIDKSMSIATALLLAEAALGAARTYQEDRPKQEGGE